MKYQLVNKNTPNQEMQPVGKASWETQMMHDTKEYEQETDFEIKFKLKLKWCSN